MFAFNFVNVVDLRVSIRYDDVELFFSSSFFQILWLTIFSSVLVSLQELIELLQGMMDFNPATRMTLPEVAAHSWVRGHIIQYVFVDVLLYLLSVTSC